jgi:8-amino-7-oxononanoate synthase
MFTASLPPSVIASVRAALETVRNRPDLRIRLWRNIDTFYDALDRRGFLLGPQKGPVVGIRVSSPEMAIHMWHALLEAGIYVNLALPPATPSGEPLLRCSVCAAHTTEQLRNMVDVLTDVAYDAGLLEPPARAAVG